jgi:CelD/BcsL family acetyltransferase involved in cellulose biosynthesis
MSEVTTQIVSDWATLAQLKDEWNPLLTRSRSDSLFLTWEWIDAWREVAGESVSPFVVTARDATGRLVGIVPLYRAGLRFLGKLRVRALRILGDYHSGGEYGDWILEPEREAEIGLALAQALAGVSSQWDCLWLPRIAGWTGARERMVSACVRAGLPVRERTKQFSAVPLPRDYREYWKALSSNARSAIQRQAKKLDASGAQLVRCATPEALPSFLDALVDLNDRRWSAMGRAGTFKRKPLELAFYRRFTGVALSRDWLRFFALKRGDEFIAVQIGYAYKGEFLQLQEGFDPAGQAGQGNVLRARVIEACIAEGITSYDFLGEFTEHKRRWLAQVREGHDLFVTHGGAKSAGLRGLGVWPSGRYLRPEGASPGS